MITREAVSEMVTLATCGVSVMRGWRQNGCSTGSGSVVNTSSVAWAIWPRSSAAIRSASTTWPPRAALMTVAPCGSAASSAALTMPVVAGVSGSRQTRISLRLRNGVEPVVAVERRQAGSLLGRAAPAGDIEAEADQPVRRVAAEHADAHDADLRRSLASG